ncbi:hypothetical protein [Endozoicomonas sp. 8E]|uniref:hypothetical protein n=1 Tax=Endozoicomonas sp. 8E TaxID=3035692 RepID=UPI00293927C4|nr:hypothetical protein [Endozoicomonas sp. 8E]WOG30101.1 hypothetical protein P6910_10730 [Endozoicomonas sp. 8E]
MSHYNNASLVEDGLKLVTSGSALAVSTAINYGFWYGICRSPEVVIALAGRFDLSGPQENELREIRSSFCSQLAAVITSAEVALAGHISPWPVEPPWWRPMRFAGTAYSVYKAGTDEAPHLAAITIFRHFTKELIARTFAGALAIRGLRSQSNVTIQSLDYARGEYTMLSSMAAMVVGRIAYEKAIDRGFTPAKAVFAYLLSSTLAERMSSLSSFSAYNSDVGDRNDTGAAALAGAGALAGSVATAAIATEYVSHRSNLFLTGTAVSTFTFSLPNAGYRVFISAGAGSFVGTIFERFLRTQGQELDSRHLPRYAAVILAPALSIALINGLSNHAIYGYPLEESLSETARSQLQKFYAPLDYLHTFFN